MLDTGIDGAMETVDLILDRAESETVNMDVGTDAES